MRHIRKGAIAIVVIEGQAVALLARFATDSAPEDFLVAFGPAGGKEIRPAIVVIVKKEPNKAVVRRADAGRLGLLGKGTVAIIAVQCIWTIDIHDKEVGPAIVIVVAKGAANGAAVMGHAGLHGDFGKGAVALIEI